MVRLLIIIILSFKCSDFNAQNSVSLPNEFKNELSLYDFKKYVSYSKKLLRQSLRRHFQKPWLYAVKFSNEVEYKIIPSMIISNRGVDFESTNNILTYLEFNKSTCIETSLLFKESKYIGQLDCSSEMLYGRNYNYHRCSFDDALEYQEKFVNGWRIIEREKATFVFSVKFIRNCWWFIVDNRCFILNLEDFKIHEANDFIRTHCSEENIREYAKGNGEDLCI